MYAGSAAPTGYLLCDGAAVSRATYAALFAAIGVTYGAGDGVGTFNVPNLKGRAPVGLDVAQAEFNALAKVGGTKTVTLTEAQMPTHNHATNTTGSGHTHEFGFEWTSVTGSTGASERVTDIQNKTGGGGTNETAVATSTGSAHTHGVTDSGGSGSHNNLQPYQVVNFIIKI